MPAGPDTTEWAVIVTATVLLFLITGQSPESDQMPTVPQLVEPGWNTTEGAVPVPLRLEVLAPADVDSESVPL